MLLDTLDRCLESLDESTPLLQQWGLRDVERGWRNLTALGAVLGLEALRDLAHPLTRILPRCPDPDMALNNVERFLANPAGAAQLPVLLESRARTLETLLQLFSTSQWQSDLLVSNPDFLDIIRIPLRKTPGQAEMQSQLQAEIENAFEDSTVLRAFRRFRQKHLLRIATNDIIRERPLEEITRDITRVADVSLEVALQTAQRTVGERFGYPHTTAGKPARCVILAFGKHGGEELNYSSDIDLMVIYDDDGSTRGRRSSIHNEEYYCRVVSELVRLLSHHTANGQAYRIDFRLRPEGEGSPLARSLTSTLSYYDTLGRTWERQALIKLRPVAGDLELGRQFLKAIEPFVYRKYLSFAEINEIKALKRVIEQKTHRAGATETEVKTGHGGIRDIEFAIQFLQLLNGGDLPELRQRNTLLAMQALEKHGCLNPQEYHVLGDAYRFLRKTEHRLQILFDLQTHRLPTREDEQLKLALRMGYTNPSDGPETARELFLTDYRQKTDLNRKILDHLLHQTFQTEGQAEPESDLILDPAPDPEAIGTVLGRYGFRDVQGAYHNLSQLAEESVRFLSTRRCRHFLASIAPHLLRAIAETPDPDMTLVNLEKVTASLGAKSILWELFSFNPPSLKLYVDLCAWSQFLTEILINNPGMIDELLDSLVLNQPRTLTELKQELADLCKGATDPAPILHSFQSKELLRIGVLDVLGKDDIRTTTAQLSDLAETILGQVAVLQYPPLVKKFGVPQIADGDRAGQPSRYAILGLGKLGGREMSYHSDLDLILVYEGDGRTAPPPGSSRFDRFDLTDNSHFFAELMQRIIRVASFMGPLGRLYQVDMRLRPTGKSGSLVTPLREFRRYYEEGDAQLWEWQSLTRARVVHGDPEFGQEVITALGQMADGLVWRPELLDEIVTMRDRLEASRGKRSLKRGPGGIVDVEFLVQMFQLKYGKAIPEIRNANTWEALAAIRGAGLVSETAYETLCDAYSFLRLVEGRLRIVHNRALDEVPDAPEELDKLARRLGFESGDKGVPGARFLARLQELTTGTRELYRFLMGRERGPDGAGEPA